MNKILLLGMNRAHDMIPITNASDRSRRHRPVLTNINLWPAFDSIGKTCTKLQNAQNELINHRLRKLRFIHKIPCHPALKPPITPSTETSPVQEA